MFDPTTFYFKEKKHIKKFYKLKKNLTVSDTFQSGNDVIKL